MSEWQPIETAPTDGSRILVNAPRGDFNIVVARKSLQYRAWHTVPGKYPIEPTHWMPLPEPATVSADGRR